MARALGWLVLRGVLAAVIGVAAAVGLAVIRGGGFVDQLRVSLWIIGCLMLAMTIFSLSPSTRHAPGEVTNVFLGRRLLGTDDRGGASLTVVLALAAFAIFGIALLLS